MLSTSTCTWIPNQTTGGGVSLEYRGPAYVHRNDIAQPQSISYICLLFMGQLSSFETSQSIVVMKRADWSKWTGANLVWMVE